MISPVVAEVADDINPVTLDKNTFSDGQYGQGLPKVSAMQIN